MGTNIVIGRLNQIRISISSRMRLQLSSSPAKPRFAQSGFSLLELMIAMFILIILLSVAVPTYQRSVQQARETVLKENLWQMRRAIEQFAGDKGKLPQNVDELVEAKYLRERPIDPVIEKDEWEEIQGEDPNSVDGEQGMVNVKSTAPGADSDGKAFSEY